jgi:hypothetical protein
MVIIWAQTAETVERMVGIVRNGGRLTATRCALLQDAMWHRAAGEVATRPVCS